MSMFTAVAQVFRYTYEGMTLTYTVVGDNKVKVGDFNTYTHSYVSGAVKIPGEVVNEGILYTVVEIGMSCFENCDITSVEIPATVTAIGFNAFMNNTHLQSVSIPNSVTSISGSAFWGCTGLESLEIGDHVTSIGDYTFYDCHSLVSVIIPPSVKRVGKLAFQGCYGLIKSAIPWGLGYDGGISSGKIIEYYLEGAIISDGWVFGPDRSIIYFAPCTLTGLCDIPDCVTTIGEAAFSGCSAITAVNIGKGVETIEKTAFDNCTGLKEVIMGPAVISLGESSFRDCTGLTSVSFPASAKAIGTTAFSNCTGLTAIELGAIEEIGRSAFSKCSALKEVIIPETVKSISDKAFDGCQALERVIFNAVNCTQCGTAHTSYGVFPPTLKMLTFGSGVTNIPVSSFKYLREINSLVIPNSVIAIGDDAFSGCTALETLQIGNSVKSLGVRVFRDCANLKNIVLPPSVETIGGYAFYGGKSVETIVMGASVRSLGVSTFSDCPASAVYITAQPPPDADGATFSNYSGMLYVSGEVVAEAYRTSWPCWNNFRNVVAMVEPTDMKLEGNLEISGKPGDTFQLTVVLEPENVSLPQIFWRSTDPEIATVDANGLVTLHVDLSDATAEARGDSDSTPSCKIIAETLYADGPVMEVVVGNHSGIEDVVCVSPDYDDNSAMTEIFNLSGIKVGSSLENLSGGIYIVRNGNSVSKIAVK